MRREDSAADGWHRKPVIQGALQRQGGQTGGDDVHDAVPAILFTTDPPKVQAGRDTLGILAGVSDPKRGGGVSCGGLLQDKRRVPVPRCIPPFPTPCIVPGP